MASDDSPRGGNLHTLQLSAAKATPPDLRQAYAFARRAAQHQPDVLNGRPGHRFVWLRSNNSSSGTSTMAALPDAFMIVGRHTQCGIVFEDDPFVALRHLLIRSIALPTGGAALRVVDLHTDSGFMLPDGTRQSAILAEGPVAISVGEYAFIAFPNDESPPELPMPEIQEQALGPYRANARPNRMSRITLMPRLMMIGEPIPPRLGRLVMGGKWGVTLERDGRNAALTFSEQDLSGGVVIGRSEKCASEALRRITDNNTSRVHVLLLQENGQVYAYDLASTQGVFWNGMPVRRVFLADQGTLLFLGLGDRAVKMYWHRIAE